MPPAYDNILEQYMHDVCTFSYLCGVGNLWHEELHLPERFKNIFNIYQSLVVRLFLVILCSQLVGVYTLTDLTPKQEMERYMFFFFSYPAILGTIFSCAYYKLPIKNLMNQLINDFKKLRNELTVEKRTLQKLIFYKKLYTYVSLSAVCSYGIEAFVNLVWYGSTFAAVVTAWPTPTDESTIAVATNIFIYCIWSSFVSRYIGCMLVAMMVMMYAADKFRNLTLYFLSLEDIFQEDAEQNEKEGTYETMFVQGVALHLKLLRCTEQIGYVFALPFLCCVYMYTGGVTILLFQFTASERSLADMISIIASVMVLAVCTGMTMCRAGDITHEASFLSNAMYMSGWQHCRGMASHRLRKMLTMSMSYAQKPVQLKILSIVDMSYASFLSVMKGAYSVFSVFK